MAVGSVGAQPKQAGAEDMVSLQLDLPPDVQRMFEEMCEMEGISQSDMLTRWIDARWEAMGYTDADLEAYEASRAEAATDTSDPPRGAAPATSTYEAQRAATATAATSSAPGARQPREVHAAMAASPEVVERRWQGPSNVRDTGVSAGASTIATKRRAPEEKPTLKSRVGEAASEKREETDEDEDEDEDDQGPLDLDRWMRLRGDEDGEEL